MNNEDNIININYDNKTKEEIEEIASGILKDYLPLITEIQNDRGYTMYMITGDDNYILTNKAGADMVNEALRKELRDKYGITD